MYGAEAMMELLHKINSLFRPAKLTWGRMLFAIFAAVLADGLQIPLQLPPFPEIIDVVAMILTSATIGFHLLLLPTFAVEFVPGVDMLPTWTGCVLAVIALRRMEERKQIPPTAVPPPVEPARLPPKLEE